MEALAGMSALIALFMLVLGVLWIRLPFAVFGTKARLDSMAAEQRAASDFLTQVMGELLAARGYQPAPSPAPPPPHSVTATAPPAPTPTVPTAPVPAAPFDERGQSWLAHVRWRREHSRWFRARAA